MGFEQLAVWPIYNNNKWNLSEAVQVTVAAGKKFKENPGEKNPKIRLEWTKILGWESAWLKGLKVPGKMVRWTREKNFIGSHENINCLSLAYLKRRLRGQLGMESGDAIWMKIGTQYDLNLEGNTVGFKRKSLGFERKLVFTLRLVNLS